MNCSAILITSISVSPKVNILIKTKSLHTSAISFAENSRDQRPHVPIDHSDYNNKMSFSRILKEEENNPISSSNSKTTAENSSLNNISTSSTIPINNVPLTSTQQSQSEQSNSNNEKKTQTVSNAELESANETENPDFLVTKSGQKRKLDNLEDSNEDTRFLKHHKKDWVREDGIHIPSTELDPGNRTEEEIEKELEEKMEITREETYQNTARVHRDIAMGRDTIENLGEDQDDSKNNEKLNEGLSDVVENKKLPAIVREAIYHGVDANVDLANTKFFKDTILEDGSVLSELIYDPQAEDPKDNDMDVPKETNEVESGYTEMEDLEDTKMGDSKDSDSDSDSDSGNDTDRTIRQKDFMPKKANSLLPSTDREVDSSVRNNPFKQGAEIEGGESSRPLQGGSKGPSDNSSLSSSIQPKIEIEIKDDLSRAQPSDARIKNSENSSSNNDGLLFGTISSFGEFLHAISELPLQDIPFNLIIEFILKFLGL